MYQRISKTFLIILFTYGLIACATVTTQREAELLSDSATRMNKEQVYNHLVGKTQVWSEGGAYFDPDGSVIVKFAGKFYPKRKWTVDDDGIESILLPDGYVTSRSSYFLKDGKVWVVNLEIFGEAQNTAGGVDSDVREGNVLADLKWDSLI